MPRSYRRNDDSDYLTYVALIAGCVLTFLICITLVLIKRDYNKEREYTPAADQVSSYHICLKVPPILDFCPSEKQSGYDEAKRNDDDLRAQKEMADWAFAVALASVAGVMLSALTLFLVFATFRTAREANEIARASAITDHRAWMQADVAAEAKIGDDKIVINASCFGKNVGRTPARRISISARPCSALNLTKEIERELMREVLKEVSPIGTGSGVIFPEQGTTSIIVSDSSEMSDLANFYPRVVVAIGYDVLGTMDRRITVGTFDLMGELREGQRVRHVPFHIAQLADGMKVHAVPVGGWAT